MVFKSLSNTRLSHSSLSGLVPLLLLGGMQLFRKRVAELNRKRIYFACAMLILIGVLAMRWNVVIGGQLFSKSLRGFMSYKMEFAGHEGWLLALVILSLPFIILTFFVKYFLATNLPTAENVVPGATPIAANSSRGVDPEEVGPTMARVGGK